MQILISPTKALKLLWPASAALKALSARGSAALVREKEDGAGQAGLQRGFLIVAGEDSVFPGEEVGMAAAEFVPVGGGRACHALADKEEVGVGDGPGAALLLTSGTGVRFFQKLRQPQQQRFHQGVSEGVCRIEPLSHLRALNWLKHESPSLIDSVCAVHDLVANLI
jgi:hypothetical protein